MARLPRARQGRRRPGGTAVIMLCIAALIAFGIMGSMLSDAFGQARDDAEKRRRKAGAR